MQTTRISEQAGGRGQLAQVAAASAVCLLGGPRGEEQHLSGEEQEEVRVGLVLPEPAHVPEQIVHEGKGGARMRRVVCVRVEL